jgi:hypothetical protein
VAAQALLQPVALLARIEQSSNRPSDLPNIAAAATAGGLRNILQVGQSTCRCESHALRTTVTLAPPDCACVSPNLRCGRFRTCCRSRISLARMLFLALCCQSTSCGRTILTKWLLPQSVS